MFFFFNDTATTEIYTLSLHDALPISLEFWRTAGIVSQRRRNFNWSNSQKRLVFSPAHVSQDRKSTRLNSSHSQISYAVFCLKKKKAQISCGSSPLRVTAVTGASHRYI